MRGCRAWAMACVVVVIGLVNVPATCRQCSCCHYTRKRKTLSLSFSLVSSFTPVLVPSSITSNTTQKYTHRKTRLPWRHCACPRGRALLGHPLAPYATSQVAPTPRGCALRARTGSTPTCPPAPSATARCGRGGGGASSFFA